MLAPALATLVLLFLGGRVRCTDDADTARDSRGYPPPPPAPGRLACTGDVEPDPWVKYDVPWWWCWGVSTADHAEEAWLTLRWIGRRPPGKDGVGVGVVLVGVVLDETLLETGSSGGTSGGGCPRGVDIGCVVVVDVDGGEQEESRGGPGKRRPGARINTTQHPSETNIRKTYPRKHIQTQRISATYPPERIRTNRCIVDDAVRMCVALYRVYKYFV